MATPNDAADEILDWGFGRGWTLLAMEGFYHSWRARKGEQRRITSSGFDGSLIDSQSFPSNRLRVGEDGRYGGGRVCSVWV
ncbi:hypothetical protein CEXT_118341 [Caerostris extrusa]|uniref:Uncharacterized protein n=1 Tax=Caerostris extrusa TaxID=172846 RepID=A0AAV4UGI2_CAEEX|nr:hypothetical protein CEXT_118341 [Caerostris extrusa]